MPTAAIPVDAAVHDLIGGVSSCIALLFLIFAARYHWLYILYVKSTKEFRYYSTAFCLLLMIPSGILFECSGLISDIMDDSYNNFTTCWIFYVIQAGSVTLFKLLSYFALCIRLIESYSDSQVYSKLFFKLWQIYLILGTFCTSFLAFYAVEMPSVTTCTKEYPTWIIGIFSIHEITVTLVNVMLFIKPLCQLVEIADRYTGDGQSTNGNDMLYLIRKTSILGLLSVLTSLMAIIMISVLNIINFWFSLDIIVTTTCIMLLFYRNQPVFSCCCGCLMGSVHLVDQHETNYSEKCAMGCKLLTRLTIHGNASFMNKNESNLSEMVGKSPRVARSTITKKPTLSDAPSSDIESKEQITPTVPSSNSNNYYPS